ncbi:MAG: ABC transporter permease subunit [Verrucomicrobiota bacterium]|nr:ABC transporter permease subunit [Verrucomicrobiota bacterium]
MARRIGAIAVLAARSAVRSHLVGILLILVPVVVFGLPLTIKGDGTLAGTARITLRYSLAAVAALLGAATLWASCLSIAGEIEGRQIQLVAVKPVRRFEIWLGKWVGLLAMNAALLAVAGVLTWLMALWTVNRSAVSEAERRDVREEILTARRPCLPRSDVTAEDVEREAQRLIAAGRLSTNMPRATLLAYAGRQAQVTRATVAPGQSKTWLFDLPQALAGVEADGNVFSVRFDLAMYAGDRRPVTGTFTVGEPHWPAFFSYSIRRHIKGSHRFSAPVPAEASGARQIEVTFANADRAVSHTAIFRIGRNLELRVREASFESNLLRALILLFGYLGLLAALGLTAGAFLSFPVAAFSVCCALLMAGLTRELGADSEPAHSCGHHGHATTGMMTEFGESLAGALKLVVDPALRFEALEPLSDGVAIPWTAVGQAVGLLLGIYPGVMGALGAWVFSRRELALPM